MHELGVVFHIIRSVKNIAVENDLCDIMNHSIIPLLYEYFYDNSNKVKNILEKAIAGYNFQVIPAKVGRIKLTIKG